MHLLKANQLPAAGETNLSHVVDFPDTWQDAESASLI
jgi:hypothetical protein